MADSTWRNLRVEFSDDRQLHPMLKEVFEEVQLREDKDLRLRRFLNTLVYFLEDQGFAILLAELRGTSHVIKAELYGKGQSVSVFEEMGRINVTAVGRTCHLCRSWRDWKNSPMERSLVQITCFLIYCAAFEASCDKVKDPS